MELIIVILFFSIASVVCVQLFVNAYKTNQSTKESSQATLITQSLAEGFMDPDAGAPVELLEYRWIEGLACGSAVLEGTQVEAVEMLLDEESVDCRRRAE